MNFQEAIAAARQGHTMRRESEMWAKLLRAGGTPIIERGQEGFRLVSAWTADEQPALVFMGADSKGLFVPDDEHRAATDWAIEC